MRSRLLTAVGNAVLRTTSCQLQSIAGVRNISTHISPLYAGHSKWANIKHIKAAKDGQKSALFQKMARQLRLAIQDGGSADPALNSQLKTVIEVALRQNMPMATIQQNLKKFTATKTQLKTYRVDLRYKQKVFMVCVAYTDNVPLLKNDMATILRKGGAATIDASHLFEDFGLIQATLAKERLSTIGDIDDAITTDAIECGAEDVELVDAKSGTVNFICKPDIISGVQKLLQDKGYGIDNTEHIYNALNTVTITPEEMQQYQKFVDKLKDVPGVEEVYDNLEITEQEEGIAKI